MIIVYDSYTLYYSLKVDYVIYLKWKNRSYSVNCFHCKSSIIVKFLKTANTYHTIFVSRWSKIHLFKNKGNLYKDLQLNNSVFNIKHWQTGTSRVSSIKTQPPIFLDPYTIRSILTCGFFTDDGVRLSYKNY